MRILHALDHSLPLHSGYAFRTTAILREQARLGWMTAQVTGPKHACATVEEDADGQTYQRTRHSSTVIGRLPVVNQLDVVWMLRRRIAEVAAWFRPDVIHAHSPCLNGLAAASVARRLGLPFVYEMRASWEDAAVSHGTTAEGSLRYRLSRALETRVLSQADAITTICEGLRNDIRSRGIAAERVTVIVNAVDAEHFGAAVSVDSELRRRYCPAGLPLLGFLGSFYAYEGLHVLLRAVALLRDRRPVHLLLVGGGPEEERLRGLVAELGIGDLVSMPGRIAQREVPAYYAITDLLVYPRVGVRLTETVTPLKPLEAMAQRRVLAASDVGGHRELIRHGETGFLFKPDDPEALANTVVDVLARGDLDAIRNRARSYVETERTWERAVSGYGPVYGSLRGLAARAAAVRAAS
ncbi:MAG: glycosyltransferase, exosortase A system-associated [Gammaproteobacteria bacterium]|nr:glycosyltransferase, exosortase A system-associated [Gammaproteobacteria bacterium]